MWESNGVAGGFPRPLEERLRPEAVELQLPLVVEHIASLEQELRACAGADEDGCCGYFPALSGVAGINHDLPACQLFAKKAPQLTHGDVGYRFNFLRLSLVRQSSDPAFHLDSDAGTALTGDVKTIGRRWIERLLLNFSSESERTLFYLDVDPRSVDLVIEGSYIRVANPERLGDCVRSAAIPPRQGPAVAGLKFVSNLVLHSGIDNTTGHFVAAYGVEEGVSPSTGRRHPERCRADEAGRTV